MPATKEITRLRKLSQQFAYTSIRMHEAIGKQTGLPGTDHKYLGFFLQRGQMTAGELSMVTGLTTGAVTSLIDRFVKQKLVKRQTDETDRRKVIIVPDLKKIEALIIPLYKDFQADTDQMLAEFSTDELAVMERYFLRALDIMNDKITSLNDKK